MSIPSEIFLDVFVFFSRKTIESIFTLVNRKSSHIIFTYLWSTAPYMLFEEMTIDMERRRLTFTLDPACRTGGGTNLSLEHSRINFKSDNEKEVSFEEFHNEWQTNNFPRFYRFANVNFCVGDRISNLLQDEEITLAILQKLWQNYEGTCVLFSKFRDTLLDLKLISLASASALFLSVYDDAKLFCYSANSATSIFDLEPVQNCARLSLYYGAYTDKFIDFGVELERIIEWLHKAPKYRDAYEIKLFSGHITRHRRSIQIILDTSFVEKSRYFKDIAAPLKQKLERKFLSDAQPRPYSLSVWAWKADALKRKELRNEKTGEFFSVNECDCLDVKRGVKKPIFGINIQ